MFKDHFCSPQRYRVFYEPYLLTYIAAWKKCLNETLKRAKSHLKGTRFTANSISWVHFQTIREVDAILELRVLKENENNK